jgi:hypothetical protein
MAEAFELLCNEAGLTATDKDYLKARGIKAAAILANIARNPDELEARVIKPYLDGITKEGITYHRTDELDVYRACMQTAWETAVQLKNKPDTSAAPGSGAPTGPAPAQAAPPSHKPPTHLPAGVWLAKITKWETSYNPRRSFPQETILGCERILARMLFELETSHQYTPLKLGEILSYKSLTAMGTPNPLAAGSEKHKVLSLEGGELTAKEPDFRDPQSQWALLDAFRSAQWIYIFTEYGSEEVASRWTNFFTKMARARPNLLHQVRSTWDASGWRVAMAMRSGKTFEEATHAVMTDQIFIQEQLTTNMLQLRDVSNRTTPGQKRKSSPSTPSSSAKGRGKTGKSPKGQAKGKGGKRAASTDKTEVCRNYNLGRCTNTNCSRAHTCSNCNKRGHPATECWAK